MFRLNFLRVAYFLERAGQKSRHTSEKRPYCSTIVQKGLNCSTVTPTVYQVSNPKETS